MTDRAYVLHQKNLRHSDHAAIAQATQNHDEVIPIFIFDPHFYQKDGLACDSRLHFMHQCLHDLTVTLYHDDPVTVTQYITDPIYTIHTATGRYGMKRNEKLHQNNVTFVQGDGLNRSQNPRQEWSQKTETYLTGERHNRPSKDTITQLKNDVTIQDIEDMYDITPDKTNVPSGGRANALRTLHNFLEEPEYWGHISEPTRHKGVSDLSTYLKFGCLSVREVYQNVQKHLSGHNKNAITSRLYWNLHYKQKLLDWAGWMNKAVNPALRNMGTYNKNKWNALKNGKTGFPMIDAASRQLQDTGWLNFRNRAMLATFHSNLLNLPWKLGADWMYYHLIDAEAGINYTQWQSQSSRVGTNLYRIYNPIKQFNDRDTDQASNWIKKYIPELRQLPNKHLAQPEKTPLHIQDKHNTRIGNDYPYPIIEYEQTRHEARHRLEQREQHAKQELTKPHIQANASLSRRGGTPNMTQEQSTNNNTNNKNTQQSNPVQGTLTEFT